MTKYVVIANRPNRIGTLHSSGCSHIGPDPTAQSPSAERRGFGDGFDALRFAQHEMPLNFGFCGHCLKDLRQIVETKKSV
ncbi:hypothetical protein [Bradyrhizobium sp. SHOUNA76]|uniref:hypothetical protein n=1 Tax=Bradyrhizobium sp. SHOUNA76 TaxID=2908927 RepID=UPI001FF5BD2C|nr:hypothetical protein [Bradyrhizobium sp. SHOUNA76]MCJ9700861.1 hypothetical protein [Bradyrhizobium sp. SHOUNA76]